MTRPVDAIPIDARGDHRPSDSCPCYPIQADDLTRDAGDLDGTP
jgi:hypothetical protein